jgi:hypothetical protein
VEVKEPDSKKRKLWDLDILEDVYADSEKLEALILEILQDQPTILAAAVNAEFGQSIRQATVMRAVFEARPMLNLLVGVCVCVCVCVCAYRIYVAIYRLYICHTMCPHTSYGRGAEQVRACGGLEQVCMYMHMYTYVYMYTYTYVYICIHV